MTRSTKDSLSVGSLIVSIDFVVSRASRSEITGSVCCIYASVDNIIAAVSEEAIDALTSMNKVIMLKAVDDIITTGSIQLVLPRGTEDVFVVHVSLPFEASKLSKRRSLVNLAVLDHNDFN